MSKWPCAVIMTVYTSSMIQSTISKCPVRLITSVGWPYCVSTDKFIEIDIICDYESYFRLIQSNVRNFSQFVYSKGRIRFGESF